MTAIYALSQNPDISVEGIARLCGFGANLGAARKALDSAKRTLRVPVVARIREGLFEVACQQMRVEMVKVADLSEGDIASMTRSAKKSSKLLREDLRLPAHGRRVGDVLAPALADRANEAFKYGHYHYEEAPKCTARYEKA